jgi:heat shock protein HslJ
MTRLTLLCGCLGLSLAACASPPAPATPDAGAAPAPTASPTAALGGHHWRLDDARDARGQRIDALLVRPQAPLQLDFADGRVVVTNACNRISGAVRADGDTLRVGPLISTKMACADPAVMALDAAIAQRLDGTPTFALQESMPPQLVWRTADGDVLHFTGEPTPETKYGGPGETVFLEVDAGTTPCRPSLAPQTVDCLRVRDVRYDAAGLRTGTPGDWKTLPPTIEGYTHEPGFRDVLRVKRYAIANPPADAPSVAYVLDQVIESAAIDR